MKLPASSERLSAVLSSRPPWLALLVIAGLLGTAAVLSLGTRAALFGLALLSAGFLIAYPAVTLVLFLTAGTFKAELETLLPLGIDLTVLLACLLVAGVLGRVVRNGLSRSLTPARLLLPYLALAFCIAVSGSSWSTDTYGQEKTIRFLALTTLGFATVPAAVSSEFDLRLFLIANIVLSTLMVAFGRATPEGLSAFGATHIATGRVVGLGIIACTYLFIKPGRRLLNRLPWLLLAALLLAGLLYSGSRGSLVGLLGAVGLVAGATFAMRRGRRYLLVMTALLIAAGAAVSFLFPSAVEMMNQRLKYALSGPLTVTARTRTERAAAALEQFLEHPFTGAGIGSFSSNYGCPELVRGDYPHNILLEVAAELGLVGLAALVLLLVGGLSAPVRILRTAHGENHKVVACTLLAIAGYLMINALFSGDLNDNRLLFSALALANPRWRASERQ